MKHKIVLAIAFISYWLGIDALFYHLNRKAKRIITFHNVIPENLLPNGQKIGIVDTENDFRRIIRLLHKRFSFSNDINDTNTITITFDDGYRNQATTAYKILHEEGNLPAIIFAAGKNINNSNPQHSLIVDLLLHWIYLVPIGNYKIHTKSNKCIVFEVNDNNRKKVWQQTIWPQYCDDSENKGFKLLSELDKQYEINNILSFCSKEYLNLRLNGIANEDISYLKSKGWILGWHTYSHFPLSHLTHDEMYKEITECPVEMKSTVMSYPYGELRSVDIKSITIASDSSIYPYALSNIYEHNPYTGKFFVPRMTLQGNFYQIHFELSGTKYFLKSHKLLPVIQ